MGIFYHFWWVYEKITGMQGTKLKELILIACLANFSIKCHNSICLGFCMGRVFFDSSAIFLFLFFQISFRYPKKMEENNRVVKKFDFLFLMDLHVLRYLECDLSIFRKIKLSRVAKKYDNRKIDFVDNIFRGTEVLLL